MTGLEGRTLDRYELRQLIGRGGMADVYLAFDPHFEREVAVKIFKREDEELLGRFVREAHLMASLNNAHLMPVFDAGDSMLDGVNIYYIVMPFLEGGSLRKLIRNSPLSLQDACRYLSEVADALDYMHRQGIIHRDIKSSNIMLDADGRSYLADFGIARTTGDSAQLTSAGNVLGTVDYMAPELFENDHKADERSDLYSLGVLLFEMVTGALPFTAEHQIAVVSMHINKRPPSPRSLVPSIPPQVERIILKALEKRPELRYASATELAQAFCQATQAPAVDAAPTNAFWEQETVDPFLTEETRGVLSAPLTSVPVSAVGTAQPVRATGTTGRYATYAPENRLPYQTQVPVPRTQSNVRVQTIIVSVLALLALAAVVGPTTYVLLTRAHANPTATATANLAATPNLTATAQFASAQTAAATAQQGKNATATAAAGVAATAQAGVVATQQAQNATATAVVGSTATVVANASATAGVIQTATAGTPEYTDPLNNANSATTQAAQWDQNNTCAFQGDGYHVTASGGLLPDTFAGCHESQKQFQNFAVKVDVSILSGNTGGLFFRMSTNTLGAYMGYLLEIDSNGNYRVSRSASFNSGETPLIDWTASPALNSGNAVNTLEVIASGNTLLFYSNGTFLTSVRDASYPNAGDIGFLATTVANGANADIRYANLNIYPLA